MQGLTDHCVGQTRSCEPRGVQISRWCINDYENCHLQIGSRTVFLGEESYLACLDVDGIDEDFVDNI